MVQDGAYPVFGAMVQLVGTTSFNHEEPQLLITCRGATCGSVNISAPRSWITGNAMVVRPKNAAIEMRFFGIPIPRRLRHFKGYYRCRTTSDNAHESCAARDRISNGCRRTAPDRGHPRMKRLRASPPPRSAPKGIFRTPAPSLKATSNPSSRSAAMDGWRRILERFAF